jgi:hypothetical protein
MDYETEKAAKVHKGCRAYIDRYIDRLIDKKCVPKIIVYYSYAVTKIGKYV